MLQPFQLQDVSVRYAEDIAELREFLSRSGFAVRSGQALGQIAARLQRDRTFHRDLTSYIWVVIDRHNRIDYSDLLAVLALAAAGESFAGTAHEEDAHFLLRFLLQARHSLDAAAGSSDPVQSAEVQPLPPSQSDLFAREEAQDSDRRGRALPWVVGAPCALLILLAVFWVTHRPAKPAANPMASAAPPAAGNVAATTTAQEAAPSAPSVAAARPAPPVSARRLARDTHAAVARRNARATPFRPAQRSSREVATANPFISPTANAPRQPIAAPATHSAAAATLPATALTANSASFHGPGPASVVPAAATARPATAGPAIASVGPSGAAPRKPSTSASPFASPPTAAGLGSGDTSRTGPPDDILHRRSPAASADTYDDGTEFADAGTPPLEASHSASAGTAPVGIVRGTTLGTMAANEVYSPLPAYPAAASASHVQGEVKLSANVDRDGRVSSVRIISGPPLLRDAALDAMQRWRYRPLETAAGPRPTTAIAVMEFKLP